MKKSGKAQRKPVIISNGLGLFSPIRIIKQWATRVPGKRDPGKLFRDWPFPLWHRWPQVLHVKWRRKDPATAPIVKVLQPPHFTQQGVWKINSTLESNTPTVLNRIWSLSKHKINTRLLRRVIKLKYTEIKRQENHRRGSPRIKIFSCIQNLITALTGTNELQIKTQKEHKGSETTGTVIRFSLPHPGNSSNKKVNITAAIPC